MDRALLSALAAILGSMVGASATIATAWLTQRTQARRAAVEAEIRKREALYGEFIAEGSKVMIDALDHDSIVPVVQPVRDPQPDPAPRLRRSAGAADRATTAILEQYFSLSRRAAAAVLTRLRGLRNSEVCRLELRTIKRRPEVPGHHRRRPR
jgi:hypothetical protein